MRPTLEPGDRLLVRYAGLVAPGRLVLARFPDGALVVKRASSAADDRVPAEPGWWLLSDNPDEGVDSRHRGAFADQDVVAVVVARAWPRPARGRRTRERPGHAAVSTDGRTCRASYRLCHSGVVAASDAGSGGHPFAGDPVFDLHVGGKMEVRLDRLADRPGRVVPGVHARRRPGLRGHRRGPRR